MKVIVRTLALDLKKVLSAGEFILGQTYQLIDGYHSGRMLKLDYISPNKQVIIDGDRHRQISGTLVGETTRVNAVLADLQAVA